jgi:acetylornithine deacetylase/succinyl-diaminopimelate desuccinylase-like protein
MSSTTRYSDSKSQLYLKELFEFLRIPSISAKASHKDDCRKAALWLQDKLKEAGVEKTEIVETAGNPIVYAEHLVNKDWPTVLVYGHYDVQPPEPLELWHSPAFEPEIRNERIYARGACDDKGQVYMHVKAFQELTAAQQLKCNVKFVLEGEEEVGSNNLDLFVTTNKEKLKADFVVISDTGIISMDCPSITVGLRGLSYLEVELTGPNRDLHSGIYGGAVPNPINVLCEMIASLHDREGKITVPGFYDQVTELSSEERHELAKIPFDLEEYKKALHLKDVQGEKGYTTIERTSIRPTLDVNGIWGGYTGEGAKTVIASKAHAKISMRLVPNQDPQVITSIFTRYFQSIAPPSVTVTVTPHHGGVPIVISTENKAYQAASKAFETCWGKAPLPSREGGSIPIVALFKNELGIDSLLMGFGLDEDAIHSPNESYGVQNFFKGIETIVAFYKELGLEQK